jgi:hypothetical protein
VLRVQNGVSMFGLWFAWLFICDMCSSGVVHGFYASGGMCLYDEYVRGICEMNL